MKTKVQYKYDAGEDYPKINGWSTEQVKFTMPNGEEIIVGVNISSEYYPEARETYGYPSNVDDRVVYYLGEDTYDFKGISCIYDEDKIKLRRALVRAYHNAENFEEGVVEITIKEGK